MSKRKTTEEFIAESRLLHGDRYDYSKVEYINNLTKVCIICPEHGDFWQTPKQHLKGCGCKHCSNINNGKSTMLSNDDFISKAMMVHGDKYDYSKIEYVNYKTNITIVCPTHGVFKQQPCNHLNGEGCPLCSIDKIKDRRIGVNDTYSKATSTCYKVWSAMMDRCYNPKTQELHPTYKGCIVCKEWHTFSNFKEWFDEHYIEGWQIDKDILVKGNKIYSPETCCFVPREINSFTTNKKARRGDYPVGVSRKPYSKKYTSTLKCLANSHLGTFNTIQEAFQAYKKAKECKAKKLAYKWKDKLEPIVYEALCNYKVEITD